jgi:hypothetical protein
VDFFIFYCTKISGWRMIYKFWIVCCLPSTGNHLDGQWKKKWEKKKEVVSFS